jgi:hypothetical protein
MSKKEFRSLKEFYPFYLSEHKNKTSRSLHFIGTLLLILVFVSIVISNKWRYFWLIPLIGYGFAWIGHAFFERNKPATFQYPFYSLASDFLMFWDILNGNLKDKIKD